MEGKQVILLLEVNHIAEGLKLYLKKAYMKEGCVALTHHIQMLARSTSKLQNNALTTHVPIHLYRGETTGPGVQTQRNGTVNPLNGSR